MLGKLIKNEFQSTYKTMLVIYVVTLITTLGCCFFIHSDFSPVLLANETFGKVWNVIGVTFVFAYFITLFSLTLLTYVLACERFYKSMYSDQGYLTHTLPVSPLSNLNARLITSTVWLLLSGIVLVLSVGALCLSDNIFNIFSDFRYLRYQDLDSAVLFSTGYHFPVLVLLILLLILAACANALLLVFAALSVGQLANLHKIRAAVGVGVALGFLEQIAASFLMFHLEEAVARRAEVRLLDTSSTLEEVQDLMQFSFQTSLWSIICILVVFSAIYYGICAFILKKHINLA